jgi:hypothetical protein
VWVVMWVVRRVLSRVGELVWPSVKGGMRGVKKAGWEGKEAGGGEGAVRGRESLPLGPGPSTGHEYGTRDIRMRTRCSRYHLHGSRATVTTAAAAAQVANSLRQLILELYDKNLSADGRSVSYGAIRSDPRFADFVAATAELQKVRRPCGRPAGRCRKGIPRRSCTWATYCR